MKTSLVGSTKDNIGDSNKSLRRFQADFGIDRATSHRSPAFASVDRGFKIRNEELDLGLKCFNVNGEARSTI